MNLCVNPTLWVQDTLGGITGIKVLSTISTVWPGQEKFCLEYRGGARRQSSLEVERQARDNFSDSYSATRPTRNWRKDNSRTN